jgi:hypothetical protein
MQDKFKSFDKEKDSYQDPELPHKKQKKRK